MNTRSQLMMTATALIAGLTLCAGAAGAQRFQPQFPIVQNEAAPERAPAGAFDNAPAVQPDYAAPADAPRYDPAPTDPAAAPPEPTQPAAPATPPDSRAYSAGATAADIAMQPAKDIGIKQGEAERGKVTGTPVGCACGDGVIDWKRVIDVLKPVNRPICLSVECGTIEQAARSIDHLRSLV